MRAFAAWPVIRRRIARALRAVLVLTLTLSAMVTSGWVGDVLKGECLFAAWLGDCTGEPATVLWRVVPMVVGFVLASYLTYRTAKGWVPVRHIAQSQAVRPHRVLIMPVSLFYPVPNQTSDGEWWVRETDKEGKVMRQVRLTADLRADIQAFSDCNWRWNGQQFLRGLAPHLLPASASDTGPGALTDLVLIGSAAGRQSSHASLDDLRKLVGLYTRAEIYPPPEKSKAIDFERIRDLQETFDEWIRFFMAKGVPESEILIDATGGQKTTSIAAALTTLRWHHVEFQYVESRDTLGDRFDREPSVLGFNVVVEAPTTGAGA